MRTNPSPNAVTRRNGAPHIPLSGGVKNAAVGYLRRSTDRQEQSIPDQQRAVERYCAEHGLTLLRCYVDDAISGTSTIGRHAFQSLMADAQSPQRRFSMIVCYDVKRFGRIDNDEAGYYRFLLRQVGVQVRYASENFAGDGTDDLLRPVKQWQAREESKDLSKVTIRGLLTKSQSGFWMGGAPPFGYDLRYESQSGTFLARVRYQPDGSKRILNDNGKPLRRLDKGESIAVSRRDRCRLVPGDPARIEAVRRIFNMYVTERRGFKAIADALNRDRVPTARGPSWAKQYSGQWAMTTVRAILVNPAYCGDMAWNRRTDARFHRIGGGQAITRDQVQGRRLESNERADWIVVRDAHPALVTRRTWDQAQRRLAAQPASAAQRGINPRSGAPVTGSNSYAVGGFTGPKARFLLSGLCTCARCGSRYEGYTSQSSTKRADGTRHKWYSYACGAAIRRGPSVCRLGLVRQEILETCVIQAAVEHYSRFAGANGRKRLSGAVQASFGDDHADVRSEMAAVARRLAKIDATVQNLLDNITAVNRGLVDQRIIALSKERDSLTIRATELEGLGHSEQDMKRVVVDAAEFINELPRTLSSIELGQRQSAIRRCIRKITVGFEAGQLAIDVFSLPLLGVGREPTQTETTTVVLPTTR